MKNLISSELYKITKSKSFIICTIIGIVMSLFVVFTYFMMSVMMKSLSEMDTEPNIQIESQDVSNVGGYDESQVDVSTEMDDMTEQYSDMGVSEADMAVLSGKYDGQLIFSLSFYSSSMQVLIAIFIAIFVAGEFSNGTIKMMVSRGYSRTKVYAAKLLSCSLASTIMATIIVLVTTVTGIIIWGWYDSSVGTKASAKDILLFVLMQFLLNIAITAVFVGIAMMFKSLGASIAISIASYSFGNIVFMLADVVVKQIAKALDIAVSDIPIMPSKLWIINTIAYLSKYNYSNKELIVGLCVFAGYTLLFTVFGLLIFNKKDIK